MLEGYLAALLMGIILGVIGAGGSILTVPILVYLFRVDPILATSYSLFVVGTTALVGALGYAREQLIDYRAACLFGLPSVIGVFSVRLWVVPNLPLEIMGIGKGSFILIIFALVMLVAAITMIRPQKKKEPTEEHVRGAVQVPAVIIEGILVGAITGFVGAGGGFLIVPALVFFLQLPVRRAIGTSLIVIAGKSLIGFCGDAGGFQSIDWGFLLRFALVSSVGIGIGMKFGARVPTARLKIGFGWFVLLAGIAIIFAESFLN
jgi:uncharacterized membrane protein YfcA